MIEHRQLQHCLTLAVHRHFGRAAEALGISQPALTRSIQCLERLLGVRLFDRRRGQIEPTPLGTVPLEHGNRILTESEELLRQLLLARGIEVGRLVVSAGLYPAELSAHRAVERLIRPPTSIARSSSATGVAPPATCSPGRPISHWPSSAKRKTNRNWQRVSWEAIR